MRENSNYNYDDVVSPLRRSSGNYRNTNNSIPDSVENFYKKKDLKMKLAGLAGAVILGGALLYSSCKDPNIPQKPLEIYPINQTEQVSAQINGSSNGTPVVAGGNKIESSNNKKPQVLTTTGPKTVFRTVSDNVVFDKNGQVVQRTYPEIDLNRSGNYGQRVSNDASSILENPNYFVVSTGDGNKAVIPSSNLISYLNQTFKNGKEDSYRVSSLEGRLAEKSNVGYMQNNIASIRNSYSIDIDGDFRADTILRQTDGSYLFNGNRIDSYNLLVKLLDNFGNVSVAGKDAEKLDTLSGLNMYNQLIKSKGDISQVQDLYSQLAFDNKLNMTDLLMGAGDIAFSKMGAELLMNGYDLNTASEIIAEKKKLGMVYLGSVLNPIGNVYKAFNDINSLRYTTIDPSLVKYATAIETAKTYLETKSSNGDKITPVDIKAVTDLIYQKGVKRIFFEDPKVPINYK